MKRINLNKITICKVYSGNWAVFTPLGYITEFPAWRAALALVWHLQEFA